MHCWRDSATRHTFRSPVSKGWLFDTLVTPALMYGAAIWGPGLADSIWPLIERPQVLMISRMIRSKLSIPYDIVRAELAAPPMLVEALFQTLCLLHRLQSMDSDALPIEHYRPHSLWHWRETPLPGTHRPVSGSLDMGWTLLDYHLFSMTFMHLPILSLTRREIGSSGRRGHGSDLGSHYRRRCSTTMSIFSRYQIRAS